MTVEGPAVERTYWANVYMDGLDPFLTKPRDIVRVMNALTVTYPAVAGEVNPVDFIAMEFLRLFEPTVYGTVRDHPDKFTGHSNDPYGGRRDEGKEFHEAWLAQVPPERREQLRALMKRLFPRLQSVWGNMGYDARHEAIWRNALRVCSADIFDVYFQFGVADDVLSRRDLNELLVAARAGKDEVIRILTTAAAVKRPTGTSKARDYLERIRDFEDEITPRMADVLVTALSDIGDGLLAPEDEQAQGIGSLPNRWRLMGVINYLLKRAEPDRRLELIKDLVAKGRSIALAADAIETVDELRGKPENAADWALAEVDDELLAELKQTWVDRMRSLSQAEFLATPELDFDLHRWTRWGDREEVVERIRPLFESDELLPRVLEKHLRFGTRHVNGDRISNRIPLLNPKTFEQLTDIYALEPRVQAMLERKDLTENQRIAGKQYLWAMGRIRQGKDPGSMRDIDRWTGMLALTQVGDALDRGLAPAASPAPSPGLVQRSNSSTRDRLRSLANDTISLSVSECSRTSL